MTQAANPPLKLSVLPEAQRLIWPLLNGLPKSFVLFGGTALALRLGHRISEDFDFFSVETFVPGDLIQSQALLGGGRLVQSASNVLTVLIDHPGGEVKISLMGGLAFVARATAECGIDWPVSIASLDDIAATKFKVLADRAEKKDYIDVHALLGAGYSMNDLAREAARLFGASFNPWPSIKALHYYDDGNLNDLSDAIKQSLRHAAAGFER